MLRVSLRAKQGGPQPLLTKWPASAGFATSPGRGSSCFRPCTDALRLTLRYRPWPAVSAGHWRVCGTGSRIGCQSRQIAGSLVLKMEFGISAEVWFQTLRGLVAAR